MDPGSAEHGRQAGGAQAAQGQKVFLLSQILGPLMAARGLSMDINEWRSVQVGGVKPVMLAVSQLGNCLCQGFAETQTRWNQDGGSCPKCHSGLLFIPSVCF